MQAIEQLKVLRGDALTRLQNNADYRLLTSLDNLIVDLETMSHTTRPMFSIVDDEDEALAVEDTSELSTHEVEKAFEDLTSDLDDEVMDADSAKTDGEPTIAFN